MSNLKGYQNTHLKCILEAIAHLKVNTSNKLQDCQATFKNNGSGLSLGLGTVRLNFFPHSEVKEESSCSSTGYVKPHTMEITYLQPYTVTHSLKQVIAPSLGSNRLHL